MTQFVTPVDFTDPDAARNKEDLKSQVSFFIGQQAAAKIEIDKTNDGYHVLFTGNNPAGIIAVTGVDAAKTAAFDALDSATTTKITIEKQANGNWTVTEA